MYLKHVNIICVAALAVVTTIPTAFAEGDFDWQVCRGEFKDGEKLKVVKECAAKTKFQLKFDQKLDEIKTEVKSLQDKDYEDGCFSQCIFQESKVLGADGKVDVSKIGEHFKDSKIKPELLKEISMMVDTCVKDTEPKFKDEKEIPCKMYSMIHICLFNKAMENHDKLKEICTK